jgi:imidazoleglycerol-phosphate dehydratase
MSTASSSSSSTSGLFEVRNIEVINVGKPDGIPICTGIGYLDHMIDQWNSHAQVGVGLEVSYNNSNNEMKDGDDDDGIDDHNRLAGTNQFELCTIVGTALGTALKEVLSTTITTAAATSTVRFCCPLDEALVECILSPIQQSPANPSEMNITMTGFNYTLAPYGNYPSGVGRSKIGCLQTSAIESFWKALGESSNLQLSLRKIRGDNAHHIVESSFKAFSRALRNYLDVCTIDLWAIGSPNDVASVALHREAKIERTTKETSISVLLLLNGNTEQTMVETGIPMLDAFYTTLAKEANMTLQIKCGGDLWVDDHHTAEDVSIAVGQCLSEALGSKAGLNRMWVADSSIDSKRDGDGPPSTSDHNSGTIVEVTMDLSNRPCFVHNLHETLGRQEYVDGSDTDMIATHNTKNGPSGTLLTCEMFEHCLDSLVMNGRMTVHIVETRAKTIINTESVADVVLCTARSFGRALRVCAMVDQRRAGTTASSKGTLSV